MICAVAKGSPIISVLQEGTAAPVAPIGAVGFATAVDATFGDASVALAIKPVQCSDTVLRAAGLVRPAIDAAIQPTNANDAPQAPLIEDKCLVAGLEDQADRLSSPVTGGGEAAKQTSAALPPAPRLASRPVGQKSGIWVDPVIQQIAREAPLPADAPTPVTTTEPSDAIRVVQATYVDESDAPPVGDTDTSAADKSGFAMPVAPLQLELAPAAVVMNAMAVVTPPPDSSSPGAAVIPGTRSDAKRLKAFATAPLPPALAVEAATGKSALTGVQQLQRPMTDGSRDPVSVSADTAVSGSDAFPRAPFDAAHGTAIGFSPAAVPENAVQPTAVPAIKSPRPVAATEPVVTARPGQIGHDVGVEIARRLSDGGDELVVRLIPAELGRIEVRMSFDERGGLRAVIAADSLVALDMLERDSADLSRSLNDAGVRSDAQSLRFQNDAGNGRNDSQPRSPWLHSAARSDHLQRGEGFADDSDVVSYRSLRTSGRYNLLA